MTAQIAVSPLTLSDADDVDDLMKRNSQTLGFLPRKALDEYLRQCTGLGAKAPSGQLVGYLLYAPNASRFRVVHLCVDNAYRAKRMLQSELDRPGIPAARGSFRMHRHGRTAPRVRHGSPRVPRAAG